jgi:hypothetical protein
MRGQQTLREKACALSRGFLIVHQYDHNLGLAFCKGFLLTVKEMREQKT